MTDLPLPGIGELPRGKWIGARVNRVEDARVLLGDARYVGDLKLPRMLHAAFVRSPYAHARVISVDTSGALEADDVVAAFAASEIDVLPLVDAMPHPTLPKTPQPPLAADRVLWVGEAVAVVVAKSPYAAEEAAERVLVEYDPLPVVADVTTALDPDVPVLHDYLGSNLLFHEHRVMGDVEGAFAQADRTYHRQMHVNRLSACPMETRGCLADYSGSSDAMTFWSSTQSPDLLRLTLSQVLPHPHHLLRVIAPDVGGGFGPKMSTYPEEVIVAYLARLLRRPVRWIEDRRENLLTMNHSKDQIVGLDVATRTDGRILGMRATYLSDSGAYSFNSATALIEPALAAGLMTGVYDVQAYEYDLKAVMTNKTPMGPYRGVGWTSGHTVREILLDEIARDLGIDPGEFRRMNMVASEQFPYRSVTGCEYDSGSYRESIDLALESVDYPAFREHQSLCRRDGRHVGIGISPYVEPTGFGTEIGRQTGYAYPSHDNGVVTMDPGGKVRVGVGVCSQGQGHRTTIAQVAASILGVDIADVEVVAGDTDRSPFGLGTWGSRGAVIGGGTVALAAGDVRAKLCRIAADMLEAAEADLVFDSGAISVQGSPERSVAISDVAVSAYFDPETRANGDDPYLSSTRFYDPRPTYSNGCFVAVVEVDIETGVVDVQQFVAVEDCGTVLNPMIVDGQVSGGIAQGIGAALLEQLVYDDDGQLLTTTFMDYLLPLASSVPPIEIHHLETPSPVTVGGIKGMGESGLVASPAAVINAVLDALGEYDPDKVELPLSPEHVLRAAGVLHVEREERDV